MSPQSRDVYVAEAAVVSVAASDVAFLRPQARGSPRGRVRLCAHRDVTDPLHEMVIAFDGQTYIRPSKHLNKEESLHIVEGVGEYVFFDDEGQIIEIVPLGDWASGRAFYCRVPENVYHTLLMRSPSLVAHETTTGPFRREDTVFAPWSPDDGDHDAVTAFLGSLRAQVDHVLSGGALAATRPGPVDPQGRGLSMMMQTPDVYVAGDGIVRVAPGDVAYLRGLVPDTPRRRVRVCAHRDLEAPLHEMVVVYTSDTYVRPNLHVHKDESLHIVEGHADFVFFDHAGRLTDVVPLGTYGSGRAFYCRVPAFAYHTILIRSPMIVIHEVIRGPFRRADTVFAPWAPAEGDAEGIGRFLGEVEGAVAARRGGPA